MRPRAWLVASVSSIARIAAGVSILALAGVLWVVRAPLFDGNFHTVIPGAVYRSAQLDSEDLDARIAELGIRSIINLRMADAPPDEALLDGVETPPDETALDDARNATFRSKFQSKLGAADEERVADGLGVAYFNVRMSAPRLAPRDTVRELIEILDAADRPILIHCRNGTERTGWASAIATLLDGAQIERARAQFAPRYGYHPWLSRSDLPDWIDRYEDWLRAENTQHSAARVREFARTGYTPYFYAARIEPVSFPERVEARRSHHLVFRVTNESRKAWTFTPRSPAGVHLGLRVKSLDPAGAYESELRGDTPDRVFEPGDSIELSATLPALPAPGRYRVTVDLVDEMVVWFAQMGSTPFERIVDAR